MKPTRTADTIRFTRKGPVVIPLRLRKQFHIKEGNCKDGAESWAAVACELPTLPIQFHAATRALADLAADFKARYRLNLADAWAVYDNSDAAPRLIEQGP